MKTFSTPSRRDAIEALSRHGGDIYTFPPRFRRSLTEILDFSGSAHVFAASVAKRLVHETPYLFDHYPDMRCEALCEALAVHEGVGPENILPGNGASELIWLLMEELQPRKVLFIGPVYGEYVRFCLLRGIEYDIVTPPPENDFVCDPATLRAMWGSTADLAVVCTPNNPGGSSYPEMQDLFSVLRVPRVLMDLSYREFLWGEAAYLSGGWRRHASHSGVAVFSIASFSHFFACPGLRLGYLIGDAAPLRRMAVNRPLWTVSAHAQAAGVRMLNAIGEFRASLPALRMQGEAMALHIRRMDCFDPDRVFIGPSFVTAGLTGGISGTTAAEALLREGIVVRNCDTIPGMPSGYIRMTIRSGKETEKLFDVLNWYAERGW